VAIYTFFCCMPDGSAPSLEMHDLPSDEAAIERSGVLLAQHRSCSHILVCDGDREVGTTRQRAASRQMEPRV
jgi:hypothetical protein